MSRSRAFSSCLLASTALVGIVALTPASGLAQDLPTGGQVVSGGVTIGAPANGGLSISQSTQRAIINWQSFNVGAGQSVNISQPNAAAALLNRVTGDTRSTIAGQINANGQVFLINPNGIVINSSGRVSAGGGFVASTLDLANDDFNAGRLLFNGDGAPAGVSNAGLISVEAGGYAALIGGQVSNSGVIAAPLGRVGLGAGQSVVLDLSGDGFLQVAAPVAGEGSEALVSHFGTISADGGHVVLTAAAARDLARRTVNMSGVIEARSVSGRDGAITLSGGEGQVAISGRLDVSGADQDGGAITVTGGDIVLTGADLDASGATGGGSIRIGGDWQGQGPLERARTTTVDADTRIRADATTAGDGGRVVLWSDDETRFAGLITARGGAERGDGGQVEVSGKARLAYTGFTDLTAANGAFGDLLLDPYNITISTGADTGGFTATADDSVINVNTLQTALGSANVTVQTGSSGSQSGDITVAAPISWSAATTLTLEAARDIAINAAITAPAGGLHLNTSGTITATGAIDLGKFHLMSGDWRQDSASLPDFHARDFEVVGFGAASFRRVTGGDGSAAAPWQVADVYGLQGIGTSAAHLAGHWTLANDIDASGTANWTSSFSGSGFASIGLHSVGAFSGSLDGNGHAIVGLRSADSASSGLFWEVTGAVRNLSLIGAQMQRSSGGLVAATLAGSISGVRVSGSISGDGRVGGLVGVLSGGVIENSYSTAAVDVASSGAAGGLVGEATGSWSMINSYASGAVTGGVNTRTGGLVGGGDGASGLTVSGNYFDSQTTGQTADTGSANVGSVGTALTTAQARDAASYVGWDFNSVWFQAGDMRPILQSEAARQVNGVATIINLHQLALMGLDLNGNYRLGADIDASATAGSDPAGIWSGNGWVPVGSFNNGAFLGFFNGQGHVISGLTIRRSGQADVGLFGRSDGHISNVGLSGGSVTGGALTGALVGFQEAWGTIRDSWSSAAVAGNSTVGGLVGANAGRIERSHASGDLTANVTAGGLVGANTGTITDSYATGRVPGMLAGGLVGLNEGDITSSWAGGAVTGSAVVGGLVGQMNGGTVSASYFNAQTTGQSDAVGGSNGGTVNATGLTTAQMADPFRFIDSGWNFSTVWARPKAGGAPVLRALSNPADVYDYYVRIGAITRTYGDSLNPALISVTGVGASNVTLGWGSAITGTTNVGTYAYSQGNVISLAFSAGSAGDYYIDYGTNGLTITARPITLTANALSRVYGDANPTLTWTVGGQGLVNGDTLAGALATTATTTSNVGAYGITQGTLAASSNYTITGFTGANLTVTARPISVTANDLSRIYGDANPTLTYTVGGQGLANGDTLSGALATTATTTSNVGTYGVTQGTLAASSNYALTFTGGNLSVTPRAATVIASGFSRAYGEANMPLHYLVTGLISGDTLTGALATTATAASNVGTYAITLGSLANANYTLSYTGADITVTARPILVTANALSRVYGDANPALTYTVGGLGLVNGDTLSGALATGATTTSGVGAYGITQGSLAASSNYALTFAGADLTVTPRPVSVTANALSRIYGDANPTLTWTASGLVNGDTLSGALATTATATSNVGTYAITQGTLGNANYTLSYTGANLTVTPRAASVTATGFSRVYGDANPTLHYLVTGLVNSDTLSGSLATTATAASNVGTYAITLGSLANANYTLSYTGADITVTARPITLTANALSRVYGDANPTLTYTVGGQGLVNGDTLTGALATTATTASGVGTYGITQGTLAASSNYALTFTGANLTVTARPISVTANALSRVFGDGNPTLTWTVGGRGLANGDTLSGALATTANANSDVGTYAITQGTLAASANYLLSFIGANLTITPRPIIVLPGVAVTADSLTRVYGDANPALTYSVTGLLNGDTLTGALATTATITSGVGVYAITQGTLRAPSNYTLSFREGTLTIVPRPVSVFADAQRRLYGDANPTLTWTASGLVNGDTLTGALATAATATSNVGAYDITLGTLSASANYRLDYTGAILSVQPRPLVVTANNQSRLFGAPDPAFTYSVGGSGLVNGDTLTGSLLSDATAGSPAGQYRIGQGTLAATPNYSLSFQDGVLTVTGTPPVLPPILPPVTSPNSPGGGSTGTGGGGGVVGGTRNPILATAPVAPVAAGAAGAGGTAPLTGGDPAGGATPLVSDVRFDGLVVCAGPGECVVVSDAGPEPVRPAA